MMDYTPRCVVVCKWTDSPTMDCPDVCLEAFWLQEWEWVLEDCHKRSCWKNSIGVSVPTPVRLDVYVCSKSCWLCITVVCWLLECNKVPSWIEPSSTLQYVLSPCNKERSKWVPARTDKSFSNQSYLKWHWHTILGSVHTPGIYYTHHKNTHAPDNHMNWGSVKKDRHKWIPAMGDKCFSNQSHFKWHWERTCAWNLLHTSQEWGCSPP
jgi:hypothetical protein